MASSELQLVISAKDEASKAFKSVSASVSSFNGKMNDAGKAVGIAMLGATTAVVGFAVTSFKAFSDAESGAIKLSKNLLTVKGNTLDHVEALKKQADEMQKYGVIEGDAIIAGQSQLATFGLQAKTIETVTEKVADMATQMDGYNVTSETMVTLNNLVGKVLTGNVGALSRYGVTLSETQQKIIENGTESQRAAMLVKVLGQNFGDVNKALGDTPYGKWIQLKDAVGDAQETIGGVLSEAVAPLMEGLANFVKGDEFKAWVEDIGNKLREWIDSIGGPEGVQAKLTSFADYITETVVPSLSDFLKALSDNWGMIKNVAIAVGTLWATTTILNAVIVAYNAIATVVTFVTSAWTLATWLLNAALLVLTSPIGLVILAVVALIAIGVLLVKNWDIVSAKAKEIWGAIETFVVGVIDRVKTMFNGFMEGMIDKVNWLIDKLNKLPKISIPKIEYSDSDDKDGKQYGGAVTTGNPVIVGEHRPEVFVPSQSGNIRQLDQVGAGKTVTVNFNNVSVRNDNDLSSIIEAVKQTLGREQELSRLGAY